MKIVVEGEIDGAASAAFCRRVEGCGNTETIEVLIDSGGGGAAAAERMAGALRRHRGRTTATLRKCDSAAMIIALAVDRRTAPRNGTAYFHGATITVPQTAEVTAVGLDSAARALRRTDRDLSDALQRATGTPSSHWRIFALIGITLTADDMLGHRLIDSITPTSSASPATSPISDRALATLERAVAGAVAGPRASGTAGVVSRRRRPIALLSAADLATFATLSRRTLTRTRSLQFGLPQAAAAGARDGAAALVALAEDQLRGVKNALASGAFR